MQSSTNRTIRFNQQRIDPKQDEEKEQKLASRREKIIMEIMATEETYHRHLKLIADYFEIPLRAKKIISNSKISVIFGNIQQLIQVNNELRLHLEEMEVGSAFLYMGPFLKLYSIYAKNHTLALTTLQELESKNAELETFRTRQEDRPEVKTKLNALLITPIQRVPRYKLLLDELFACTPATHVDYASLKKAVKQISTIAMHINDHIKEHENFQKMIEIQKSLEGSGAPKIVAPGRKFIKEGILKRMSRNGGRSYERMFFLFSDMIMYAKPKMLDNGHHHHSCCCVLPLHHCSVENMFGCRSTRKEGPTCMSPDDRGGMFKLSCKDENLLLYSENKETVNEWMTAFREAIGEVKQSRQTLRKESSAKRPMRKSALQRQWRRDKMRKMRDEIKAADDTITMVDNDESSRSKIDTPSSCRPEASILKYRNVIKLDGDRTFCTPKKKLKLDTTVKESTATPGPPEDSFELIDDSGMDEFNVTMPRFFKQLSYSNVYTQGDPKSENDCGEGTSNLWKKSVKCTNGVALHTLERIKKSKAGQTLIGSINKSLTRIKKRIPLPRTRRRCHSDSAANDTNISLKLHESSTDIFSLPEDNPTNDEPTYDEISFLPTPDLSLPPLSMNAVATQHFQNYSQCSETPHNMSSLHLQNIMNQPKDIESSMLQPPSMQPQSFRPPQSLKRTQRSKRRHSQSFDPSQSGSSLKSRSMNSLQRESLITLQQPLSMDYMSANYMGQHNTDSQAPQESFLDSFEQPLSMDYSSVNLIGQENLSESTKEKTSSNSFKKPFDVDNRKATRAKFSASHSQKNGSRQGSHPESYFSSLPPEINYGRKRLRSKCGRSASCASALPVLQEFSPGIKDDPKFFSTRAATNESLTPPLGPSNSLSKGHECQGQEGSSGALNLNKGDQEQSSAVEVERKQSCTII